VQTGHDVDEYVIRAATAGDSRAQEAIYRHYHKRVYQLAYRLMGQEADAQDVTQDCFVRCFQALHQYRGDAGLWAWIKPITIRTGLMKLRVQRRWNWFQSIETEGDTSISVLDQISDEQPGPEREAQRRDLHKALAQLNSTARAVIYLYHVEGYGHGEIADLWGKSVSFSKSQLARAQRRLRELLAAYQVAPDDSQAMGTERASRQKISQLHSPKEVLS
jgi:RNA polymerase sigma-70 factor (ECF subfamily)